MKHMAAVALFLVFSDANAQSVSYESVRLSELFVESAWQSQEQALEAMLPGLETQLRQAGATERGASVFALELKKALNRESIGKALALFIDQKLTTDEMKELATFMKSNLGQKYLQLSRDLSTNIAVIGPIIKQACTASLRNLEAQDRKSVEAQCTQP